jgi:hypothetical protein
MKTLIKVAVALAVLAGVGVLIVRSIYDQRAKPYTVGRDQLRNWTLVSEPASRPNEPMLSLRPPPAIVPDLFRQVFSRAMESLTSPTEAAMPLLLKGEFDRALVGHTTAEAVAEAARTAGLESIEWRPRCLIHKHVSEPGDTRQLFLVLFDAPEFTRFRERVAGLRADGAAARAGYDAWALSPVLFIAASDAAFNRWLPLRADPEADCVAPLVAG